MRAADRPQWIDIRVVDGPLPDSRFVAVENSKGEPINVGTWLQRDDGYWVLRLDTTAWLKEGGNDGETS